MFTYRFSKVFILMTSIVVTVHLASESSFKSVLQRLSPSVVYAKSKALQPTPTRASNLESPSEQDIKNWLKAHQVPQVFTWQSKDGLEGNLQLSIKQGPANIYLSEESFGFTFDGLPKDNYSYTQRTFETRAPYRLKKVIHYQQTAGQAYFKLWLKNQVYINQSDLSSYPERNPAKLRAYAKKILADLEQKVSKGSTPKHFESMPNSTQENLLTHLGLGYPHAPLSKSVYLLDMSASPVQDRLHKITQADQRLIKLNLVSSSNSSAQNKSITPKWLKVYEHKIVDEQGHSSRSLLKQDYQVISTSISYQHQIVDLQQLTQAPPTLSRLLYTKGRMPTSEIKTLLQPYKAEIRHCLVSSKITNLSNSDLVLRLSFITHESFKNRHSTQQSYHPTQLSTISFKDQVRWGAIENCIAKLIQSKASHLEKQVQSTQELLIEFPLKQL